MTSSQAPRQAPDISTEMRPKNEDKEGWITRPRAAPRPTGAPLFFLFFYFLQSINRTEEGFLAGPSCGARDIGFQSFRPRSMTQFDPHGHAHGVAWLLRYRDGLRRCTDLLSPHVWVFRNDGRCSVATAKKMDPQGHADGLCGCWH